MLGRIAIHLSQDKNSERRMDFGLRLAAAHKAEVMGIYPLASGMGLHQEDGILPQEIRKAMRNSQAEHREATQDMLFDKAKKLGVSVQWRAPQGDVDDCLALHARLSDLIIMSKVDPADNITSLRPNLPETVVMAAGRPVLMLPNYGEFETVGERIMYCWDQRREAARALTDAAPFLRECKALLILEVDRDEKLMRERDVHENDIVDYCLRLGYPQPKHKVEDSAGYGVGNVILNNATDNDIDLIVMGAYGHSRMRQWIMGGATSTLLGNMTVPVLLAN